jgi:hypothetical protein
LEGAGVEGDRLVLGLAWLERDAVEAAQRADGLLDAGNGGSGADVDLGDIGAGTRAGVGDVERHVG